MPNLASGSSGLRTAGDDVGGAAGLETRGLRLAFPGPTSSPASQTAVLRGVDLAVPAGGSVALLGPSGCGKTTLLRTLAGLERPDAGAVRMGNALLVGDGVFVPPERRRIGLVFQDWALFPHMSVARNVGFGLNREQRRGGGIADALALVGLTEYADRMPSTLSGGQQQRVALARALANRPAAILLDEPFSNLDTSLRGQVRGEVCGLLRRLGVTALFVTHDQEEAFVLGDEVAVMLNGRIEQQAHPAVLYQAPATRAVAEFVGDANLLPGQAEGMEAFTTLGTVPLTITTRGSVDVLVRPEFVDVREGDGAQVERVEYYGHDAIYIVQTDAGPALRARVLTTPRFGPGDRVALAYAGAATAAYSRH